MYVIKRDGKKVPYSAEKIHEALQWGAEDLTGVSVSDVEMNSGIQLFDGMTTSQIDEVMIRSAADLISEQFPNYQYMAGRLNMRRIRKEALGQFNPLPVKTLVERNIARNLYTSELLTWYDDDDWAAMDKMIRHDRDFKLTYAATVQLEGKYLVQDRVLKKVYETPQYLYMLVAATSCAKYPRDIRMNHIKSFYDNASKQNISLPTPIMAGVRTPQKQFSSCVLVECGDSIKSINATTSAITEYISNKAGIGVNAGSLRALGSKIRGGDAMHTGVIPFFRMFQAAVKSCSQGGVRDGAATLFFPLWHREIEDVLVLKNNKGTEENRLRRMDYGIQVHTYLVERFLSKGNISLFSPHEVPGLYDAFFSQDPSEFGKLYEQYEANPKVPRKTVPARDLFAAFMTERAETGRIYSMLVDEVNRHSPFKIPIKQSNLCMEIGLPTSPLESLDDDGTELRVVKVQRDRINEYLEFRDKQTGL
jgi:ribonucleoside-diphosphate reductase alpha chain